MSAATDKERSDAGGSTAAGGSLSELSAGAMIPESVARCPECGGRLYLDADFGELEMAGDEDASLSCVHEPDLDEHEERIPLDVHRFRQSDWMPVINTVSGYLRKRAWAMGYCKEAR